MSALRQRPSPFLGGPEKGKQDKELVTNLEKTSYEAKMIPCPGTCSQQSQDRGTTRLRKAKTLGNARAPWLSGPSWSPRRRAWALRARCGKPLQGEHGRPFLLCSTRRGAARPSRAPNPLYKTKTPSSLTMVFRQCSVLVYLVGGGVGWGGM
jgi:hypothetical protein